MSEAEYVDDDASTREAANEFREILTRVRTEQVWNRMSLTEKFAAAETIYHRKNYPNAPDHVLYQNILIAIGIPDEQRMLEAKQRYAVARITKVGHEINCPGCNKVLTKKSYQHTFCDARIVGNSTCKDFCNNWFSPKRLQVALNAVGANVTTIENLFFN